MNITLDMLPTGGRPDIIPINASGLKVSACKRRWYLTVALGLKSKHDDATPLRIGKICHKHIEMTLKDKSPDGMAKAMIATNDASKSLPTNKAQDSIKSFIAAAGPSRFPAPMLIDGELAIEKKFNFPIDELFSYVGTLDLLTFDASRGVIGIIDHKTSSKWRFQDIIASYEGDSQFLFYSAIVQRFAYDIFKHDMDMGNLAWYRKFFIQANVIMLSVSPITIRRGPEWSYSEALMERFWSELKIFIEDVRSYIHEGVLPPPTGMTCNVCPSCPFKTLCFAGSASAFDNAIVDFAVEKYEPLKW